MPLPEPKGLQKKVLYLPDKGHYVVLGTAGSGKTTLAILRAMYLADLCYPRKVLLTTFNKALVAYLESIADVLPHNVDVRNYHRFARGYLNSRGKMGGKWDRVIVPSIEENNVNPKLEIVEKAIQVTINELGLNATLQRAPQVFLEEINWIERIGITTYPEYLDIERIGRSATRITRENRKFFYRVFENYCILREKQGYKYDFDDIARYTRDELMCDTNPRMYKHVIIDEGQDFSPVMLQSLACAIPSDGSLTFFGDVAQQIYGSRLSWRHAGINIKPDHVWRFEQNYRNTKEIAELALEITKMPLFGKNTDLVAPQTPAASGPPPALVEFKNEDEELAWIIKRVGAVSKNESVAILVRNRELVRKVVLELTRSGLLHQVLKRDMNVFRNSEGISVGTYHSAKGLEFDTVFLPYLNNNIFPDPDRVVSLENRDEALSDEIKLIYVAITRARRSLIMSYTGQLTELLPPNSDKYKKTIMG